MSENVFVSGSTGLLGSHLLAELLKRECSIQAMYRSPKSIEEVKEIIDHYALSSQWDRIKWVKADVLDVDRLQELMEGVDQVYHCAALVSFDPSDAARLQKINVEGTQNMLNAAMIKKVKSFLHVSSTAAIGKGNPKDICTEENEWDNSDEISDYSKSKFSSEREVWRAQEEGLETIIVNPCVIIGPGDPEKSSGTLFSTMSSGLKFYTEGGNAFVDARDVADIMVQLMNSNIRNERFLCIGENLKFREVFNMIADEMGVRRPYIKANAFMTGLVWRLMKIMSILTAKAPKITSESAASSHRTVLFSNDKVKDYLQYNFINIEDAIKNSVAFMKATQRLK